MSVDCHHEACRNRYECGLTLHSRVQLHPATDNWMQGDKWGEIVCIPPSEYSGHVHVKMDVSKRILKVPYDHIYQVY